MNILKTRLFSEIYSKEKNNKKVQKKLSEIFIPLQI